MATPEALRAGTQTQTSPAGDISAQLPTSALVPPLAHGTWSRLQQETEPTVVLYPTDTHPTSQHMPPSSLPNQSNIIKQIYMASAALVTQRQKPSPIHDSPCSSPRPQIRLISLIQVGCVVSAISELSNKCVMFLSFRHTKLLCCNVPDGSKPS